MNKFGKPKDPKKLSDETEKEKEEVKEEKKLPDYTPPPPNENFPLNMGMRGNKVKAMQVALKEKFKSDLGKYGSDGIFGKDTISALRSAGFDSPVAQGDYDNILAGKKKTVPPPAPLPPKKTTEKIKVTSKYVGSPVWSSLSDWTPYRLAGHGEYVGYAKEKVKDYWGNEYIKLDNGKFISVSNTNVQIVTA
jgi:hypothetical protein